MIRYFLELCLRRQSERLPPGEEKPRPKQVKNRAEVQLRHLHMTWLLASSDASWSRASRNVGISPTSPTPIRPLSSRSILVSRHLTPEALKFNPPPTISDFRSGIGVSVVVISLPFVPFLFFYHLSLPRQLANPAHPSVRHLLQP